MKIEHINTEHADLLVYKYDLPLAELELKVQLSVQENSKYLDIKSQKRKMEFLVSRILLADYFGRKEDINYTDYGAPRLQNGYHLSISHCKTHHALLLSKTHRVAVDIENPSKRVLKIKNKAFNNQELAYLEGKDMEEYTKFWCAKEVMIKSQANRGIDFQNKIQLYYFQEKFLAKLLTEKIVVKFELETIQHQEYTLVYTQYKA